MSHPNPLFPLDEKQHASGRLSAEDDTRLLLGLIKQGGVGLTRRWLAALMLVPESEREAAVESIEAKIADLYGSEPSSAPPASAPKPRSASTHEAMERLRAKRAPGTKRG